MLFECSVSFVWLPSNNFLNHFHFLTEKKHVKHAFPTQIIAILEVTFAVLLSF